MPKSMPKKLASLEERFLRNRRILPNGCVEWTGSLNHLGYGRIFAQGRYMLVHRRAWERANGQIPKGLMCLHHCDNRQCVNLNHLFLGTQADNMRDCAAKKRTRAMRGSQNGNSKLTDADVLTIRTSGEPTLILAKQFNVCRRTIIRIRRGQSHWTTALVKVKEWPRWNKWKGAKLWDGKQQ